MGTAPLRRAAWATLALVAALGGGCTTVSRAYDFTPAPAAVLVRDAGGGAPIARVLASVIEARRRDDDPEQVFEMHLRLRVERLDAAPLALDTGSLLLLDARLTVFGMPTVKVGELASPALVEVPADGVLVCELRFPFPNGRRPSDLDLDGLNLRWMLRRGDQPLVGSTEFQRVVRPTFNRDPYAFGPDIYGYPYSHYHHWW